MYLFVSHSKNKVHGLTKCAIFFPYAAAGIDVSEDALRGMKFGRCSVGKCYPLASAYEYTKRESLAQFSSMMIHVILS